MQEMFKAGAVKREDVFVATKLWNNNHRPERVKPAFEASLRRLRLDYIDLYLDRKSTRLNSSHQIISYAVFCLKKKTKKQTRLNRRTKRPAETDRAHDRRRTT